MTCLNRPPMGDQNTGVYLRPFICTNAGEDTGWHMHPGFSHHCFVTRGVGQLEMAPENPDEVPGVAIETIRLDAREMERNHVVPADTWHRVVAVSRNTHVYCLAGYPGAAAETEEDFRRMVVFGGS